MLAFFFTGVISFSFCMFYVVADVLKVLLRPKNGGGRMDQF
jgi:hypothetical protein